MLISGSRGREWPSRQRVAKIGFFRVPRPCERAEAATKTSWESREGFSSGGRGEWAGAETLTSGSRGRGWSSRQRVAKIGFFRVPRPCERAEAATKTSWESREGFSPGGKGLGGWAGRAESKALTSAQGPQGRGVTSHEATGGEDWFL